MIKNIDGKIKRQYLLPIEMISRVDTYSLRNGKRKSEVVEMALKKFLRESGMKISLLSCGAMMLGVSVVWAAEMSSASQAGLVTVITRIVSALGWVVGGAALGYGMIRAAWEWKDDQARAIEHLKGGIIGGVLGGGAGAIAIWIGTLIS